MWSQLGKKQTQPQSPDEKCQFLLDDSQKRWKRKALSHLPYVKSNTENKNPSFNLCPRESLKSLSLILAPPSLLRPCSSCPLNTTSAPFSLKKGSWACPSSSSPASHSLSVLSEARELFLDPSFLGGD